MSEVYKVKLEFLVELTETGLPAFGKKHFEALQKAVLRKVERDIINGRTLELDDLLTVKRA